MEDPHAGLPAPLAWVPRWLVRNVHCAHVPMDVCRMEVLQPHHDRFRRPCLDLLHPGSHVSYALWEGLASLS